ncbi:hypothetical protein BBL81_01550 [Vibrio parahaemolyticus]|nr:hypothetical protein WR36_14605 [Vibrio parahaemolyticus]OCH70439.1 hypothetical protein A6E00_19840 [Vibrio diabolicus]OKQ17804.1 hypothetical protein H058_16370 [Vibrio antiquarius]KOC99704.1 hypothetical protein ACS82_14405 [Vibrio parahaemolyticus]KOE16741.1 hypothetical protein ACS89_09815 [Vibrio parahaemolyticus]
MTCTTGAVISEAMDARQANGESWLSVTGNGTKTNEQDAVQQLWIIPEPSTQLMVISAESELNDEAISMLILGEPQ